MIDITKKGYPKYVIFGSLYFSFGLNAVFLSLILPLYFVDRGLSPALVTAVISIMAIPLFIKFVWGGIVDFFIRFGRKPFIISGGFVVVLSLVVLSFLNPKEALVPFIIIDFLNWVGIGFLTVSLDALVISTTIESERGKINGIMYAGQNGGIATGALLLPFIATTLGYNVVFLAAGGIIFPTVLLPLIIRENKIVEKSQKVGALLLQEFKKRTTVLIAIFTVIVTMSSGMILLMAPIWMDVGLQLNITQVGLVTMLFTITIAIGSITGGILADKLGRKTTLYILLLVSVFFTALLVLADSWEYFTLIYGIIGFLQGGYITPVSTMCMDVTNPRIGATQFSIFASLINLGIISAATISGSLYVMLGISRLFLYAAWVFGPALLVLYYIRLKSVQTNQ
jgi:MFS family permease